MDVSQYWAAVRQTREKLEAIAREYPEPISLDPKRGPIGGKVYITSLADAITGTVEGAVCESNIQNAAERIIGRTHRVSTQEEIERFHQDLTARGDALARTELRNKPNAPIFISQEQAQQAGIIMHPPPPAPAKVREKTPPSAA